jgi:CRISPR associated protein Cas1
VCVAPEPDEEPSPTTGCATVRIETHQDQGHAGDDPGPTTGCATVRIETPLLGVGQVVACAGLIEEFRAPVVDTVVLEALRGGALRPEDFNTENGGACRLTDSGLRRFLGIFEQRMLTTFAHVPSGQRVSYRRALFLQARQLAAFLRGLRDDYRPVSWR